MATRHGLRCLSATRIRWQLLSPTVATYLRSPCGHCISHSHTLHTSTQRTRNAQRQQHDQPLSISSSEYARSGLVTLTKTLESRTLLSTYSGDQLCTMLHHYTTHPQLQHDPHVLHLYLKVLTYVNSPDTSLCAHFTIPQQLQLLQVNTDVRTVDDHHATEVGDELTVTDEVLDEVADQQNNLLRRIIGQCSNDKFLQSAASYQSIAHILQACVAQQRRPKQLLEMLNAAVAKYPTTINGVSVHTIAQLLHSFTALHTLPVELTHIVASHLPDTRLRTASMSELADIASAYGQLWPALYDTPYASHLPAATQLLDRMVYHMTNKLTAVMEDAAVSSEENLYTPDVVASLIRMSWSLLSLHNPSHSTHASQLPPSAYSFVEVSLRAVSLYTDVQASFSEDVLYKLHTLLQVKDCMPPEWRDPLYNIVTAHVRQAARTVYEHKERDAHSAALNAKAEVASYSPVQTLYATFDSMRQPYNHALVDAATGAVISSSLFSMNSAWFTRGSNVESSGYTLPEDEIDGVDITLRTIEPFKCRIAVLLVPQSELITVISAANIADSKVSASSAAAAAFSGDTYMKSRMLECARWTAVPINEIDFDAEHVDTQLISHGAGLLTRRKRLIRQAVVNNVARTGQQISSGSS